MNPTAPCLVVFSINDAINFETSVRPFDAKFGSMDGPCLQLPVRKRYHNRVCARFGQGFYILICNISSQSQEMLLAERLAVTPLDRQNAFQARALIPIQLNQGNNYQLNFVQCKNLVKGNIRWIHVTRLKLFHGSVQNSIAGHRSECYS